MVEFTPALEFKISIQLNAKLNKKDKFNKYAIDNNKNAKYNTNTELNKKAK